MTLHYTNWSYFPSWWSNNRNRGVGVVERASGVLGDLRCDLGNKHGTTTSVTMLAKETDSGQ